MPSPIRTLICHVCGATHQTRSRTARTCSKKCAAIFRQSYAPNGRKPRDYPSEIVQRVRDLYESGLSIAEVQADIGKGVKVQNVMRRYGIEARPAVVRAGLTSGDKHYAWKGSEAGYQALHLRVQRQRGKPSLCEFCGTTSGQFEWANQTGSYADVNDYKRLCVPCHRIFDAERRAIAGHALTPPALREWEVMCHV